MKLSDIEAVARGLRDIRPGSYPSGLPDDDRGWASFETAMYSMTIAVAGTCTPAGWAKNRARFEDIARNEKGG